MVKAFSLGEQNWSFVQLSPAVVTSWLCPFGSLIMSGSISHLHTGSEWSLREIQYHLNQPLVFERNMWDSLYIPGGITVPVNCKKILTVLFLINAGKSLYISITETCWQSAGWQKEPAWVWGHWMSRNNNFVVILRSGTDSHPFPLGFFTGESFTGTCAWRYKLAI